MVGATLPMAAIAEAIQPQETAEQQAQANATNSDTGKAKNGADTSATADTAEDSTATSTGTSAANTESADATDTATPGTAAATDTATTTPPHPSAPKPPHARRNLRHVANHLRPLRHRNPKRRHLHRLLNDAPRAPRRPST